MEFSLQIGGTQQSASKIVITPEQAAAFVSVIKPKTITGCDIQQSSPDLLQDAEFWRNLYACLKDQSLILIHVTDSELTSKLTMCGFTQIQNLAGQTRATKPSFKVGGTSIRDKKAKQAESNPWGNLTEQPKMINEDELMKDETLGAVTEKFCGTDDRIMPGKPCENCTCGRKELVESETGVKKLETGQVESSCGKCYLGDAFRCASCPFLGKPAF